MKKFTIVISLCLLVVMAIRCNKKDDGANLKNATVSKWTFNGKRFTANNTQWHTDWGGSPALVAMDTASSFTIAALFRTKPTSSSHYTVVSPGVYIDDIPEGEVLFILNSGGNYYFSMTEGTVDVKIVDGKIKIIYSNITGINKKWKSSGVLVEQ